MATLAGIVQAAIPLSISIRDEVDRSGELAGGLMG
jgi:hypothetical protein